MSHSPRLARGQNLEKKKKKGIGAYFAICLPRDHLGVRAFQIELEFGNDGF